MSVAQSAIYNERLSDACRPRRTCISVRFITVFVVMFFFVAGCGQGPVDITSAYVAYMHDPKMIDAEGWPVWDKLPQKGVNIGQPGMPEADRLEYVGFLWDQTGLYGRVYAFQFPQIELARSTGDERIVIMATTPARHNRTLGEIGVFRNCDGRNVRIQSQDFRSIDRGWVMKPGQCQSEFWVSWKALGFTGPPSDQVTIYVRGRTLVLNSQQKIR